MNNYFDFFLRNIIYQFRLFYIRVECDKRCADTKFGVTMGSNSSILLRKEEIDEISHETGFNEKQIKRLYNRFASLDKVGHLLIKPCNFNRLTSFFKSESVCRILLVLDNQVSCKTFLRSSIRGYFGWFDSFCGPFMI